MAVDRWQAMGARGHAAGDAPTQPLLRIASAAGARRVRRVCGVCGVCGVRARAGVGPHRPARGTQVRGRRLPRAGAAG